jgi:arylsulfatase A-like enzyme
MTIDLLPTVAGLVGAELPEHRIDGRDIWPLLSGVEGARSPAEAAYFFYYKRNELHAVLSGRWKLYFPHEYRSLGGRPGGTGGEPVPYDSRPVTSVELYDLLEDVSETTDVAAHQPEVVERLVALGDRARGELGDSLRQQSGSGTRAAGRPAPDADAEVAR